MAAGNRKINSFIYLYVMLPLFTVLALANARMFNRVYQAKSDNVIGMRKLATSTVEDQIGRASSEAMRFGYLPEVLDIIGSNTDASDALRRKEWTFETWFDQLFKGEEGRAAATKVLDREMVVNNDITKAMRRIQQSSPHVGGFLFTDNLGVVIAASRLPDTGNARNKEWWREAFRTEGKPNYGGMTETGLIYINYSIWSGGENSLPIGMARIEIKMPELIENISSNVLENSSALIVMGSRENSTWYGAGDPETIENHGAKMVGYLGRTGREEGWVDGIHYSRDTIKQYQFPENIRVLAIQEGALINLKAYLPVGITSFASLAGLGIIIFLARRAGNRLQQSNRENIQAGNWILHRMRGDGLKEASGSRISKQLDTWMNDFRRSVVENVEVQEYESKRELHLAREFQLSYMDRPYPRIPEVYVPGRLKLNFYHYYKPAMALGGDFFEILKLGPETAGVAIADVMGHGTRSALITSNLRAIMSELQGQGRNARNYLREMNREFYNLLGHVELQHPIFASAFYFVADTVARSATFSTAGHPAPFHLKRSLNHVERLQVSSPHGAALGILKDEDYTGGSCRLTEGDVFVFFTDGVYEAFNAHGDEFGLSLDRTI